MLFLFLFLAPVFTCNQAKFRRGQVTPSYRIVFFRRAESWPPYRAVFANAVLEKSTKNEKRPDSYKSGR